MAIPDPDERFDSDAQRTIGRFGDTVRRRAGPWTPAVHELLRYLETKGYAHAPRVLGFDEDGNEILTYLPGESGTDVWAKIVPEEGLGAFARLLRSYHDAVIDFRPRLNDWAATKRKLLPGEIICHGDFGPWNTVWQGDRPAGIINWDLAGPGLAIDDIAYALEYAAPFRDDEECVKWLRYPSPPDRAHRIAVFAKAYGLASTDGLVDAVVRIQFKAIDVVRALADAGAQPQVDWVASGYLEELAQRAAWTSEHRRLSEGEGGG